MKKIMTSLTLMCMMSSSFAASNTPHSISWKNLTMQVVEINSKLENIDYNLDALNLGLSEVNCGYHCKKAVLFSLPGSDDGELTLFFWFRNCRSGGEFKLPFTVQNDSLVTLNPGTYHAVVEGTYCGSSKIDIILSGDSNSDTGYHIDLVGKW